MKKVILIAVLIAALGLVPLMSACSSTEGPEEEVVEDNREIVIGDLEDLSGPAAATIIPVQKGFADYWRYVNEELGGISGIKVKHLWVDHAYEVPKMLAGYERVKEAGALCWTSGTGGAVELLMGSCEEDQIICASGSSTTKALWPPGWVYGSTGTSADLFCMWVDWILSEWKESRPVKVAVLYPDISYGHAVLENVDAYLADKPVELIEEITPPVITDATPHFLRVQEKDPDFIYLQYILAPNIVAWRDAKRLGIDTSKMSGCFASVGLDMINSIGSAEAEGYTWTMTYDSVNLASGYDEPEGTKLVKRIHDKYRSSEPLSQVYAFSFGIGAIVAEAYRLTIEEVGYENLTGEALKEYGFDRIENFSTGGITPDITYMPDDHRGVRAGSIFRVQDGKDVPVAHNIPLPCVKP